MYLLEFILLFYFAYVSLYSFTLSLAGLFYKTRKVPDASRKRSIAVLIPAYKEDRVIPGVAAHALKQQYPSNKYDVVIIADSLQQETLFQLKTLPVILLEVSFEKSTKVKALNRALEVLGDSYDIAVVLDADNIMDPHFLDRINNLFEAGYRAVQGRREPKNENTSMALLDGLSETINNFIYRQGTVALGLSASLNGSGMAFEYNIYKKIMAGMDSIGGFDRELELKLIERGINVYFAKNAIVYDEKVESTEVFERQRRRWLSSQFFYLKKYFGPGISSLFKGDLAFFNSAVLRNIQLPRLLNLGLLALITVVSIVFSLNPLCWIGLLAINILSMVFAIPRKFYSLRLLKSILLIPTIFIKMLTLLFRLKGANKTFIHTPHQHVETSKH